MAHSATGHLLENLSPAALRDIGLLLSVETRNNYLDLASRFHFSQTEVEEFRLNDRTNPGLALLKRLIQMNTTIEDLIRALESMTRIDIISKITNECQGTDPERRQHLTGAHCGVMRSQSTPTGQEERTDVYQRDIHETRLKRPIKQGTDPERRQHPTGAHCGVMRSQSTPTGQGEHINVYTVDTQETCVKRPIKQGTEPEWHQHETRTQDWTMRRPSALTGQGEHINVYTVDTQETCVKRPNKQVSTSTNQEEKTLDSFRYLYLKSDPPDPYEKIPGYHPEITTDGEIQSLMRAYLGREGSYILRPSRGTPNDRTLTIVENGTITSYRIFQGNNNSYCLIHRGPHFASVQNMISYYEQHALPNSSVSLKEPIL